MVLTSTHNLCFELFLPENFQFLEVKFSIYLTRRVFVMELVKYLYNTEAPQQLAWVCTLVWFFSLIIVPDKIPFSTENYGHLSYSKCPKISYTKVANKI